MVAHVEAGAGIEQDGGELDTDAWVARLSAGGHFRATHVEHVAWTIELSSAQVRDLFTTFSDWDDAEVDEAARAVTELGGRVVEHYVTPLIVLARSPAAGAVEGQPGPPPVSRDT